MAGFCFRPPNVVCRAIFRWCSLLLIRSCVSRETDVCNIAPLRLKPWPDHARPGQTKSYMARILWRVKLGARCLCRMLAHERRQSAGTITQQWAPLHHSQSAKILGIERRATNTKKKEKKRTDPSGPEKQPNNDPSSPPNGGAWPRIWHVVSFLLLFFFGVLFVDRRCL